VVLPRTPSMRFPVKGCNCCAARWSEGPSMVR
jgi:hypothetical protein